MLTCTATLLLYHAQQGKQSYVQHATERCIGQGRASAEDSLKPQHDFHVCSQELLCVVYYVFECYLHFVVFRARHRISTMYRPSAKNGKTRGQSLYLG
ncbi:hypothetical protein BU23DRAFT_235368 [Bimuria novae-zelandiae CBS 107.79]|uniref:Uncharacterized protein n=1 Tax=Bimuria novae-zelandiae CBS 107.79 TaxID=1447943 RepID=A0A6A5UXV8_9PLEO|nr:hypothetical protein BU23DRAFT_235368 [Bimuria novae-zelandiae CBS 107.79]